MSNELKNGFTYKNSIYRPFTESDGDCVKIYHEVDIKIYDLHNEKGYVSKNIDWSPYSTPTVDDFKLWVDLGFPRRNGPGPLDSKGLLALKVNK